MFPLSNVLDTLLASLPPHPAPKYVFDNLVEVAIEESKQQTSVENRRSQWEYLLRNEVYQLADSEGAFTDEPDTSYYKNLCDRLDIILAFTEHDVCEATFLFTVLQDLLEMQTVASCSHIFSWIERRSERLTEGMVPQKGKALVLLRTLNDLLRRLSKTGNTTTFCGRILTFLSAVFPLGERSGVNLRGEYGPQWEGVALGKDVVEEKMEVDEVAPEQTDDRDANGMKVEEDTGNGESGGQTEDKSPQTNPLPEKPEDDKTGEFYNTFWSLQLPLSRPPLFASPDTLSSFKSAVDAVMPVIKEATIKERAMMGSKAVNGTLKRKREATPASSMDDGNHNYFFAKFLTSPDLIELEIADTMFRRQFLFQLLILLNHLLQFTKADKAIWATARNRSLQMDFTLQPDDAKWVQETVARVYDELRQTTPNGRAFADTVQVILDREKNWVRWKNDLCSPFDKEPLSMSLEDSTATLREKMQEEMGDYKHKFGSEALSEIWAMGYRDLHDLQNPFVPGSVKDFVKDIEKENARIALRKQQLEKQTQRMQEARARAAAATKTAAPSPAPAVAPATQTVDPLHAPLPSSPPAVSVSQRPIPPPSAASPPLHPSLPAKPGTNPVTPSASLQPSVNSSPVRVPTPAPKPVPAPTPSSAPPIIIQPPEVTDPMIMKAEENKQRISWLALRTARDEYLHHFGRIGNGDVILLAQEIEKEKERIQRGESQPANPEGSGGPGSERAATPSASTATAAEGQSDIAMQPLSQEETQSGAPVDTATEDAQMVDSKANPEPNAAISTNIPLD